jgi:hypothetical protein
LVNGKSSRQSLVLKQDPRLKATDADYAREFSLARQIENARARLHVALRTAKTLDQRLIALARRARSRRAEQLNSLDARLMALAALSIESRRESLPVSPPLPDTLQGLSDSFDKLADAVDGADGSPTPDAESGLRQRQQTLAQSLQSWNQLQSRIETALSAAER